jgi:hypothetical protein
MTAMDFWVVEFPDEDRDGSWNTGLLAIQPPDMAVTPRIFYWIVKWDLKVQKFQWIPVFFPGGKEAGLWCWPLTFT